MELSCEDENHHHNATLHLYWESLFTFFAWYDFPHYKKNCKYKQMRVTDWNTLRPNLNKLHGRYTEQNDWRYIFYIFFVGRDGGEVYHLNIM